MSILDMRDNKLRNVLEAVMNQTGEDAMRKLGEDRFISNCREVDGENLDRGKYGFMLGHLSAFGRPKHTQTPVCVFLLKNT